MPGSLTQSPGYLWQQIMKLQWIDFTDADAVLFLDSDEMLTQATTPRDFQDAQGRWRWIYRSWGKADTAIIWKAPTSELLGFEPPYESMCVTGFVLERNTTHKFIEYLKELHKANSLWEVFFKYNMTQLSEYNAVGSYINRYDNDTAYYKIINSDQRFINHSILKSWSYGGLNASDKQTRETILGIVFKQPLEPSKIKQPLAPPKGNRPFALIKLRRFR
jgi:hypothetical protein